MTNRGVAAMFRHFQAMAPAGSPTEVSSWDCVSDPNEDLRRMFVDLVMGRRIASGQDPVLRPVFLKVHAVAQGTFTVRSDLPPDLRVGVFAGTSYPVWIRFSSDTVPSAPDLKTTVGIGIKLFHVPGTKILEPETDATTHDFLLQNHDVFFVDTATDMCQFTYAGVVEGNYDAYLDAHPITKAVLDDMTKVVPSVLGTSYWSGLPFAFGTDRFVKYKLSPSGPLGPEPPGVSQSDPNYLAADVTARLRAAGSSFDFFLQFRTDPDRMPLDQATVRWEESVSPPVHVATITLSRQDVTARGQAAYGENLAFTTWHALPEHAPVGSIAEARKVVYQASATRRRNANGVPTVEPTEPRATPEGEPDGEPVDGTIVRAAIHPAIGIARVGDSADEFYIGPEVVDPQPPPARTYKDATGALKREAARFRVYGYNASGEVVRELTAAAADITWTVHVANAKAAWYQYQLALDVPEAAEARPSQLRNQAVQGAERAQLVIDPGPRSIRGTNTSGPPYAFDSGRFMGKPVYLGELQTDAAGRLVFLGGRGVSASSDGSRAGDFANNDKWHDDVSDGPVTAEVSVDGRRLPVEPAWVVTGPPNYAPDIIGVRNMYDLLYDAFVTSGALPFPEQVSFTEHIEPILRRLCNLQWVNHGFAAQYGWGGREHFLEPAYLARLSSPAPRDEELRRQVLTAFRLFDRDGMSPVPWPWIYGDAMSVPAVSPRQFITLSATQYKLLETWVSGDFLPPLDGAPYGSIDDVPLAEQPAMLDRAALTYCLADAFHPGCEMTWTMRHLTMYSSPFRIRHRAPDEREPVYPPVMTPEVAVAPTGPLNAQSPGGITRWMAVPWQTDSASCRDGYEYQEGDTRYDPYLPTFWPARVPNHVLTEADYQIVMDTNRPLSERLTAFEERAAWYRFLPGQYLEQINFMIGHFGQLGVVERRAGPGDHPAFPPEVFVESELGFPDDVAHNRNLHLLHVPEARDPATAEVAIANAIAASPFSEDEVTAGYIAKVKRFPRRW